MKELIERWCNGNLAYTPDQCAAELQAWLGSLWTEITEDPATWPPKGGFFFWDCDWDCVTKETEPSEPDYSEDMWHGDKWRPIIPGIDTP